MPRVTIPLPDGVTEDDTVLISVFDPHDARLIAATVPVEREEGTVSYQSLEIPAGRPVLCALTVNSVPPVEAVETTAVE